MTQGPRYQMKPRRHREIITDYRQRLKLLKSRKIRIVIRKSLRNTQVQFIDYNERGDNVLVSAASSELVKHYEWKYSTSTLPAAYLTGVLAGKRAKEKGIQEGILDIGRYVPASGSKVFAVLRGILDAGIVCPHKDTKFPSDDRILGRHLNKDIAPTIDSIKSKMIGGK